MINKDKIEGSADWTPTSQSLLQSMVDAILSHVALVDENGLIVYVNRSWRSLADASGIGAGFELEANLLESLEKLSPSAWPEANMVAQGVREVISGRRQEFSMECSYRQGEEILWLEVRVTPTWGNETNYAVVAFENITERRLRERDRFFELSPNILCTINYSGYITRINPAVESILGYSQAEMCERPFIEFVHPDDIPATLAEYDNLLAGALTIDFQNRYICKDGSCKWISWTCAVNDGSLTCAAYDVTQYKEAEASLRESERWMRTLTECLPQIVFACRPDGWNTYFNQRWVDYTGLSIEESHGHGWTRVFHPDDQQAGSHAKDTGDGYEAEARLLGADGNYRWFLIRGTPFRDPSGAIESWMGTCTDIEEMKRAEQVLSESRDMLETRVAERTAELVLTNDHLNAELVERMRTEEALRDAQEMLQLVMNHIPQAIFWKDRNCVYLGSNDRLARDAGFNAPAELVGKTCFDMPWAEHAPGYQADDRQVMESDTPKLNITERLTTAEGAVLWLRTNKIPLHNKYGEVVGVLGSYENITEQREAVEALKAAKLEAERANQAKSEFLSRMSHELRTPLNAILGFGQILELGDLEAPARESVSHILKGGRHLLGLINEVLDIARVESGHSDLSLEPVLLRQVVEEALALLQPLANQANIRLKTDESALGSLHVLADLQRLKQVLINIVSNGIKYNRPGGILEVSCQEDENGGVRLSVRDTGRGMSQEDLQKIFTPFQRLEAAAHNIEGSGLGLALSKQLVKAMGGLLEVESELAVGSTFSIYLPEAVAPSHTVEHSSEISTDLPAKGLVQSQYTVLCVEDNVSNLHLINCIFRSRNDIKLITAVQGSLGLDMARQHQPDLILLDLDLPDISGREVLAKLSDSSATADIPVVIVSADATASQIERLLAAGAKAYLTKPLDIAELLRVVDEVLRGVLKKAS